MYEDGLPEEQRRALLALEPAGDRGFYLAGGAALGLRLGHRQSIDLDLFREEDFDPELLLRELAQGGRAFENVRSEPGTLSFEISGVPVSLMRFQYPRLGAADTSLAVPVAALADIAAMKVEAIASPGARKDFVDLYMICREGIGLTGAIDAFKSRFASAHPDLLHRLKALTTSKTRSASPN